LVNNYLLGTMNDLLSIGSWFNNSSSPIIIAGPCSAESEDQVLATARAVASTGRVHAFRAGVWKPRSRPATFSGEGSRAIKWLARVKDETGLPIALEAGTPRHVEEALESGVADIIWLGSRTVTNPFSVEEIASALSKSMVTVLIKNPLTPDIDLWSGAVERVMLLASGVLLLYIAGSLLLKEPVIGICRNGRYQ
jgi:chorismate mutase